MTSIGCVCVSRGFFRGSLFMGKMNEREKGKKVKMRGRKISVES